MADDDGWWALGFGGNPPLRSERWGTRCSGGAGGARGWGGFEGGGGAFGDGLEEFADGAFVGGEDAFDEDAAGAGAVGDEDLAVEAGGYGADVWGGGEAGHEGTPVADAVAGRAHEFDVGGGADESLLEVAAHAVGDGKRDDEGGDAGGDTGEGNRGDEADDALAAALTAARAEVTRGNEKFKAHWWLS